MKRILVALAVVIALLPIRVAADSLRLVMEKKFNFNGKTDEPREVAIRTDNSFVIGGFVTWPDGLPIVKPAFSKISSSGNLLSIKIINAENSVSLESQIDAKGKKTVIAFGGSIRLLDSNDVEIWTRNMPGEAFVKVYRDTIIAVCSQSGASMVYILNDSGETIRQFSLGVLMSYPSIAARENTLYVSGTNPVLFGVAVAVSLSDGQKFWQFNAGQTYKNRGAVDDSGNFYFAGSQLKFPDSGVVLERVLIKLNPQGEILWKNEWLSRESQETNMENWNGAVGVSTAKNMVVVGGSIQKGNTHTGDKSAYLEGFAASTGAAIWKKVWDYPTAPVASINQISSIKFDHDRYLIVLGSLYSSSVGNPPSYGYLQKYQVDKVLGVQERKGLTPSDFRLEQNYPNPFNSSTTIKYSVGLNLTTSDVVNKHMRLAIYDLLGREVAVLADGVKPAGEYEAVFNASNLPSGIYFYRLNTGAFTETKKMLLAK